MDAKGRSQRSPTTIILDSEYKLNKSYLYLESLQDLSRHDCTRRVLYNSCTVDLYLSQWSQERLAVFNILWPARARPHTSPPGATSCTSRQHLQPACAGPVYLARRWRCGMGDSTALSIPARATSESWRTPAKCRKSYSRRFRLRRACPSNR